MKNIQGIKATNKDMTCRDFQFQFGLNQSENILVKVRENGLHFSSKVENVFSFYDPNCRLFHVTGTGIIDSAHSFSGSLYSASDLIIEKECDYNKLLSTYKKLNLENGRSNSIILCALLNIKDNDVELLNFLESFKNTEWYNIYISYAIKHDRLVDHFAELYKDTPVTYSNKEIFKALICKGRISNNVKECNFYEIEKLMVSCGHSFEKYINCDKPIVLIELVKQKYCLDKLIDHESHFVRAEVARQGYGLDKLINDDDVIVRSVVAQQGYGLDKLVDDNNILVALEVAKHGYGYDKIGHHFPVEFAKFGYIRSNNIFDKNGIESVKIKKELATNGFFLDKLCYDKNSEVREIVAAKGYKLGLLCNDKNDRVREIANYTSNKINKLVSK